jgi:crossover junction endodeoxyribonuclease RusA
MTITFPWPPKQLSPNSRSHWTKKAHATKHYKWDCTVVALEAKALLKGKSKFILTFRPPDKRLRDADNLVASFKAGFDALSKVSGVDDYKFEWTYVRGEPCRGGAVIVEVLGE